MAATADHGEVLFAIRSRLAPANKVMDLEFISPATALAFPAIPLQDFPLPLAVTLGAEPNRTSPGNLPTHADRLPSNKNSCCCEAGRNPNDRRNDISWSKILSAGLSEAGFKHIPRVQPLRSELRKGAKSAVPLADRAIDNLQQWLIGTYHGVSRFQLQVYPDEFVFSAQPLSLTYAK
jgi:hypothetical protein